MAIVNLADYTTATVEGTGVFDVLMKAINAHLDVQWQQSRIRGPEYAQVYLGSLQTALDHALQFVLGKEKTEKEVELLTQQVLTEVENTAMVHAQKCKLDAEYDVLILTKDKVTAETLLLNQKRASELAQTDGSTLDPNSILGKQATLYQRQADGFLRDAEQRAASIMIDSWNVRRTTDNGTVADGTNKLSDLYVGNAVTKLLEGISA